MSDLRQKITSFIAQEVAKANVGGLLRPPRVGFASPEDPLFHEIIRQVGPHHLHPFDILPETKTVVSFFVPFPKFVVEANRREKPVARLWGLAYLAANAAINHTSESLVTMVKDLGGQAALMPATYGFDPNTFKTVWSHRSAALIAGHGRFGLNRMLIGPLGGAGRYGTIFISKPIAPSPKQREDYCLNLKKGSCRSCVKACPVGALTDGGIDRHKCHGQCLSNSDFLNFYSGLGEVCGRCVTACPRAFIA
ncbi:MAG: epoxyqueuosine reductase [Deltaproteobacteria bacterium]|jgi:epoxyqueuosine reductase QueG|nr:epoxyqueuosine reductase [Deltaproteobacteria bacterium]